MKKIILYMFMLFYNIINFASDNSIKLTPIYLSKEEINLQNSKINEPKINKKKLDQRWKFLCSSENTSIDRIFFNTFFKINKLLLKEQKSKCDFRVMGQIEKKPFPHIYINFKFYTENNPTRSFFPKYNEHIIQSRRQMLYAILPYLNFFNINSDEELKKMHKKLKEPINEFWDGINNKITTMIETYNLNPDDYTLY